jgi:hypothetical protein
MPEDKRAVLKQWLASGQVGLHPLTFPQRELWEASPAPVADRANHICCLIHARGALTEQACQNAMQLVVDRQDVLRLSFLPGKDRPLQMIRRSGDPSFIYRELPSSQAGDEAIEEVAEEVFAHPFDLVQGPLYRVEILKRSASDFVMAFAIHHAIADGWTLGVFVGELCIAYAQGMLGLRESLPVLPLTYAAWGAAERSLWPAAKLDRSAAYWKTRLAGSRRLWSAQGGPDTAPEPFQRWVSYLPAALGTAIQELARVAGVTLYSALLAALQIAFSRWSGTTDILVGTPVANRTSQAVRETMGYCAGIVPVRGEVDDARPFTETLRAVHETSVDSFANAMPFAELAAALGERPTAGHNPIFEVRFALQNHPVPEVNLNGLSARLSMRSTGTARFHLGCEITVMEPGFEVVWLFRPKLLSKTEIEELAGLFQSVLEGVCCSPESRIAALAV